MRVILVMVQSVNGKITLGDDSHIYHWTSKEDAGIFFKQIQKHNLIVMGSRTYEAARKKISHRKGQLRIVLTHNPKKYASEQIAGTLAFCTTSPRLLVEDMRERGYKEMLLVGGGEVNMHFIKESLIDEIYLTIEPKLFGRGKPLFTEGDFIQDLCLKSVKKLNKSGTLLLHYLVLR